MCHRMQTYCVNDKADNRLTEPVIYVFLGSFVGLRKSDYQLRHVCLSVRMEQLDSQRTDFGETL
jgi:hypothetical protein